MLKRLCMLLLLGVTLVTTAHAAEPPKPGTEARCAVCGMFVAPFPQWLATLQLADGRAFYFDGPKDLFIFYFDLPRYVPGASADQVAAMYVTEYYSTRMLPVGEVLFVTGSDVLGPMGQELVPVSGLESAITFQRDHAGQNILRFSNGQLVDARASQ